MMSQMSFKIFDSLPTAVAIVNSRVEICYINASMVALARVRSVRRKIGRPFTDLINIEDQFLRDPIQLQTLREASKWSLARDLDISGVPSVIQYSMAPLTVNEFSSFLHEKSSELKFFSEGGSGDEAYWIVYCRDYTDEAQLDDKYQRELDAKEEVIGHLQGTQKSLEKKVAQLEKRVEDRKLHIRQSLSLRSAVLDSMGEGFFVINGDGTCQSIYSLACERFFKISPKGRSIYELMQMSKDEQTHFAGWLGVAMMDSVPFSDLQALCPLRERKLGDLNLSVSYHPLRSEEGDLTHLVVVVSDQTERLQQRFYLESERNFSTVLAHVYKYRSQFQGFVSSCQNVFQRLQVEGDWVSYNREAILMDLHTLRGGAASFYLTELHDGLCDLESQLAQNRKKESIEDSEISKVKNYGTQFSQHLQEKYSILDEHLGLSSRFERCVEVPRVKIQEWVDCLRKMDSVSIVRNEIHRNYLLSTIDTLFLPLSNEVLRLSQRLHKEVSGLTMLGGGLRIRTEVLGQLPQVLIHLVRNSLDHGLENPEERVRRNKPRQGQIILRFETTRSGEGNQLIITLEDDGAGINLFKLKERLQDRWQLWNSERQNTTLCNTQTEEKNIPKDPSTLTEQEILKSIFLPGMSTRDQVTQISGRGVGASAVLEEVERLGGNLSVYSEIDRGTRFVITLPLNSDDIHLDSAA
jgi:two-component system chemotaxis sensor kinase CheA